jgi:hypothetical protein
MGLSERSLGCKKNKKNLSALCVSAVAESVGFSTLFRSDFCLENGEYYTHRTSGIGVTLVCRVGAAHQKPSELASSQFVIRNYKSEY